MAHPLRFLLTREHKWGAPTPLEGGSTHPISVLPESVASDFCYLMLTCAHFDDATHSFRYNYGKLDFTNEMEYQPGSPLAGSVLGTVSNVNTFLNTLKWKHSPTGVMMLHASKPTTNMESLGYVTNSSHPLRFLLTREH